MASNKYRLIPEEDAIDGRSMHHHDKGLDFRIRGQFSGAIVFITLAVSLATNAIFIMRHFIHGPDQNFSKTVFGRVSPELCITH